MYVVRLRVVLDFLFVNGQFRNAELVTATQTPSPSPVTPGTLAAAATEGRGGCSEGAQRVMEAAQRVMEAAQRNVEAAHRVEAVVGGAAAQSDNSHEYAGGTASADDSTEEWLHRLAPNAPWVKRQRKERGNMHGVG